MLFLAAEFVLKACTPIIQLRGYLPAVDYKKDPGIRRRSFYF